MAELAPVFTLADARPSGMRKDPLYELLARGDVERLRRGVYVRPDEIGPVYATLAAATAVRSAATMCLTSALVHHGLSDAIPLASDIPVGALESRI